MKWKCYNEKNKDNELRSGLVSVQDESLVNVSIKSGHKGPKIYHVLDATVYICGLDWNGIGPQHTIVAETQEKIQKAKSKLEELTGVELIKQ